MRTVLPGGHTASSGMGAADSPALMPDQVAVRRDHVRQSHPKQYPIMKGTITKVWLAGSRTSAVLTQATTGRGTRREAVDGTIGWLSTLDMPATLEVVPA